MKRIYLFALTGITLGSCHNMKSTSKEDIVKEEVNSIENKPIEQEITKSEEPSLLIQFSFDPNLERLGNLGEPASIGKGNASQNPVMNEMSSHYIELAPTQWTQFGEGEVLYRGEETQQGGERAIDFDKVIRAGEGEKFMKVSFKDIAPGTYEWIRVSISYQNFEVDCFNQIEAGEYSSSGTAKLNIASFVGFNNYITDFKVKDSVQHVGANKLQGFWMGEMTVQTGAPHPWDTYTWAGMGDAEGTTVVNPNPDSPVPEGSCVVTGKFSHPITITGNETEDQVLDLAFSINNSFEWKEIKKDGLFQPAIGEEVVDMGLRGLHPRILHNH